MLHKLLLSAFLTLLITISGCGENKTSYNTVSQNNQPTPQVWNCPEKAIATCDCDCTVCSEITQACWKVTEKAFNSLITEAHCVIDDSQTSLTCLNKCEQNSTKCFQDCLQKWKDCTKI